MLATQIEVSNGTLSIINVGLEFFNQTDISISLDQAETPLVLGVDYLWSAATTVQFLNTGNTPGGFVPSGVTVILRRSTKNDDMLNIYDGGAAFSRLTLDENFEQLLRLSQEFAEGLGLDGLRNNLDMNGYRVVNLGDPVNAGDATSKEYVDTALIGTQERSVRVPEVIPPLPAAAARADLLLSFNSLGDPVMVAPVGGSATALAILLASTAGAGNVGTVSGNTVEQELANLYSLDIPQIQSVTDLRAMTAGRDVYLVDYNGGYAARTSPDPRGGGRMYWIPSSVAVDDGVTVFKLTAVGTGRLHRQLDADGTITPDMAGALGDGITNDAAAIQASVTVAENKTGNWYLPGRTYVYDTTITQTKRLTAQGSGHGKSILQYSGAAEGWKVLPPYAGASNTGYVWKNFQISPTIDGGGTYGLRISLSPATGGGGSGVCFLADSQMTGMFLGGFGQWGFWLDNSTGNTDGFFTSQFEYNVVVNGMRGDNVGDSLTFAHNKLYGKNQFQMEGVPGARQLVLDDCNITTTGGLVALLNIEEAEVHDCQLEHPGYLSGYTGVFGASVLLFNCYKPVLRGNTINGDNGAATAPTLPGLVPDTIALTGTTAEAIIEQNDIQKGVNFHINIAAASVVNTYIGEFNTYYGAAPVIGDGGTGTKRILYATNPGFDPPNLVAQATTQTTLACTDALPGMFVEVGFGQNLAGVIITAWVSGAGTVTVQFYNPTAGAINLAPAVLRARVTS